MIKNTQTSVPLYEFNYTNWKDHLKNALKSFSSLNQIEYSFIFEYYTPFTVESVDYNKESDYTMFNKNNGKPYIVFVPKYLSYFSNSLFKNYIEYIELEIHKQLKVFNQYLYRIKPALELVRSGLYFDDILYKDIEFNDEIKIKYNKLLRKGSRNEICYF